MKLRLWKSMLALAMAVALWPQAGQAHDYRVGSIHIDHPWAIATPSGAKTGAGYMKITNDGKEPDRLIALTSAAAQKVMLHSSVKEGDVVKMRAVEKGLEIKPGETIELKPDGMHVMFEGLKAPLLEDGRVPGTLVFEKAGKIDVDYAIEPMGTRDPDAKPHTH